MRVEACVVYLPVWIENSTTTFSLHQEFEKIEYYTSTRVCFRSCLPNPLSVCGWSSLSGAPCQEQSCVVLWLGNNLNALFATGVSIPWSLMVVTVHASGS